MKAIGIMQGRLSPPSGGRIQSFPVSTWREEFDAARRAGLHCIEWIYEAGTDAQNPLTTDSGIAEMQDLAEQSGVAIWSVCADYYMEERLVTPDGRPAPERCEHLQWLVGRAALLGARHIVLPFVDSSSALGPGQAGAVCEVLRAATPHAEAAGVGLHLETDLPPTEFRALLEDIGVPHVRANLDIGNSASLGYNPRVELTTLGPWLGSVHVKDRVLDGTTVPLGEGSADFATTFAMLSAMRYSNPLILQVARKPGVDEVEYAIENRKFVERSLAAVAALP